MNTLLFLEHIVRLDHADLVSSVGVGEDVEDLLLDGEGLDEDLGLVTLLGVEGDLVGVSALWLETKRLLSENIPHSEQSGKLQNFSYRRENF